MISVFDLLRSGYTRCWQTDIPNQDIPSTEDERNYSSFHSLTFQLAKLNAAPFQKCQHKTQRAMQPFMLSRHKMWLGWLSSIPMPSLCREFSVILGWVTPSAEAFLGSCSESTAAPCCQLPLHKGWIHAILTAMKLIYR